MQLQLNIIIQSSDTKILLVSVVNSCSHLCNVAGLRGFLLSMLAEMQHLTIGCNKWPQVLWHTAVLKLLLDLTV